MVKKFGIPVNRILILLLLLLFSLNSKTVFALPADTLSLTLADAENLFQKNNFQLLAAKFNVSAADAAVIQAKLWSNPVLSIDQGAYNENTKKWFDISKSGETAASLQQLILLGGKRRNQIGIAKINSRIAQYQFFDLVRTLRYT